MFKNNVGSFDRMARVIVGAILVALAIFGQIGVWGYIGIIPILTGLIGTCPLYSLLGISTCPAKYR